MRPSYIQAQPETKYRTLVELSCSRPRTPSPVGQALCIPCGRSLLFFLVSPLGAHAGATEQSKSLFLTELPGGVARQFDHSPHILHHNFQRRHRNSFPDERDRFARPSNAQLQNFKVSKGWLDRVSQPHSYASKRQTRPAHAVDKQNHARRALPKQFLP